MSLAVQVLALPLSQTPDWQVSVSVQALPSEQGAPSAFGALEHAPVRGSHVPASWHWSTSHVHGPGGRRRQRLLTHTPGVGQSLASSHRILVDTGWNKLK